MWLEIDFVNRQINLIEDAGIRKVLQLILSRTFRSYRAATRFDFATLKVPQFCLTIAGSTRRSASLSIRSIDGLSVIQMISSFDCRHTVNQKARHSQRC